MKPLSFLTIIGITISFTACASGQLKDRANIIPPQPIGEESDGPPMTFASTTNRYIVKKVQPLKIPRSTDLLRGADSKHGTPFFECPRFVSTQEGTARIQP